MNTKAVLENPEQEPIAWPEAFYSPPPSRKAIHCIRDKSETLVSVCNARNFGRPKTSTTEKNDMLVALAFVNSPKKPTKRALKELFVQRTTLRLLTDKLKLKSYRPRVVHGLLEDDQDCRLQFCELIHDHTTNEQSAF